MRRRDKRAWQGRGVQCSVARGLPQQPAHRRQARTWPDTTGRSRPATGRGATRSALSLRAAGTHGGGGGGGGVSGGGMAAAAATTGSCRSSCGSGELQARRFCCCCRSSSHDGPAAEASASHATPCRRPQPEAPCHCMRCRMPLAAPACPPLLHAPQRCSAGMRQLPQACPCRKQQQHALPGSPHGAHLRAGAPCGRAG